MEDAPQQHREERRRIAVALHSPLPSSSAPAPAPHAATAGGAIGPPSGAGVTTTTGSPKSLTSGAVARNPFFNLDDPFEHISQPPVSAPAGYSPGGRGPSRVRKDRTTRRSADVLLHVRAIDDGGETLVVRTSIS